MQLALVGAEYYVLGTEFAEIKLESHRGGFQLTFREPVYVATETLLGKVAKYGYLCDVQILFANDMPPLSMAEMHPGKYPVTLRRGQRVEIH